MLRHSAYSGLRSGAWESGPQVRWQPDGVHDVVVAEPAARGRRADEVVVLLAAEVGAIRPVGVWSAKSAARTSCGTAAPLA